MTVLTISALENMILKELYAHAKEYKVAYYSKLTKKELIFAILKSRAEQEGFFFMEGVLEIIQSEGYGFLRPINYSPSSEDIYISASQIRRFDLRNGDKVSRESSTTKRIRTLLRSSTSGSCQWRRSRSST